MEQRLKEAAQEGNINELYELIREDPCLLEPIDQKPFADTPLHIAAEAGHTHFALEIMRLKPSFARKPNPDGFSPMHLALQNGKIQTVLRLVNVDPELVRVKGREGVTSLHYIAEEGNHDLLAEFLTVCPKSVQDLTIRSETAVHIAVKNDRIIAFEVLLGGLHQLSISAGSLHLKHKVLDSKDEDGNTVLHIATSTDKPQVVKMLVRNGADVNAKNSGGLTALDILPQSQLNGRKIKSILRDAGALQASRIRSVTRADCLRSELSLYKKVIKPLLHKMTHIPNENINTIMVVAVLITTTTYQAGLSPPGGVWLDDLEPPNVNTTTITNMTLSASSRPPHRAGTTVLNPNRFYQFASFNSTAFYISITIILVLLRRGIYGLMLQTLLMMLVVCHALSVWITSGQPFEVYIAPEYLVLIVLVSMVRDVISMVRDKVFPLCRAHIACCGEIYDLKSLISGYS